MNTKTLCLRACCCPRGVVFEGHVHSILRNSYAATLQTKKQYYILEHSGRVSYSGDHLCTQDKRSHSCYGHIASPARSSCPSSMRGRLPGFSIATPFALSMPAQAEKTSRMRAHQVVERYVTAYFVHAPTACSR
jgi:hypothetical protein